MKVLTVGAAGDSAGLVTQALSKRGVEVRGLVHSPGRVETALNNGAHDTAVADLHDKPALISALDGMDAVFHIVPAFAPDGAKMGVTMVEAAIEAGVRRIVFSSVYHPSLADLSNHRDKQPVEQAIYDSDLEFTILQPAMFMSQLTGYLDIARRDGVISGPYSSESKMAYVDYRDVAEAATLAFTTDGLVGGTFELSGPGQFSRHDIADELTTMLGKRVIAAGAVPSELDSQMSAAMCEGLLRMFHHYDVSGFHGGNSLVLDTLLDHPATSVVDYLRELSSGSLR
ncbi:SDR family oxidoreductase [Propionibacterium sp.]|uniref:SDR family oxidoreductase n=1 Tax=Propionibacterium sp. TaxID=1977903 RepID=UPI0039EC0AB1